MYKIVFFYTAAKYAVKHVTCYLWLMVTGLDKFFPGCLSCRTTCEEFELVLQQYQLVLRKFLLLIISGWVGLSSPWSPVHNHCNFTPVHLYSTHVLDKPADEVLQRNIRQFLSSRIDGLYSQFWFYPSILM